jgi:hypothetical protein
VPATVEWRFTIGTLSPSVWLGVVELELQGLDVRGSSDRVAARIEPQVA